MVPSINECNEIATKYEVISEHVCINCGKPDVYMTNAGWIMPICEECFKKMHWTENLGYEACIDGSADNMIPDSYKIRIWANEEIKEVEYDISETVAKIRKRYTEYKKRKKEIKKRNLKRNQKEPKKDSQKYF